MMERKMTKEEKARELRWRAEDDARIMAQYQEIINEPLTGINGGI